MKKYFCNDVDRSLGSKKMTYQYKDSNYEIYKFKSYDPKSRASCASCLCAELVRPLLVCSTVEEFYQRGMREKVALDKDATESCFCNSPLQYSCFDSKF